MVKFSMKAHSRTKTPLTAAYPGTATLRVTALDQAARTGSTNGAFVSLSAPAVCPALRLA